MFCRENPWTDGFRIAVLQELQKKLRKRLLAGRPPIELKLLAFSKRVAVVWSASLLGAAAAFFTQLLLARHLAVNELGLFSSTLAIMALAVPVAGLGMPHLLLKLHGSDSLALHRWRSGIARVSLVSQALVILALICAVLVNGRRDGGDVVVFILLILFVPAQVAVEFLSSKLKAFEQIHDLSRLQFLPQFLRLAAVVVVYIFTQESFSVVGAALAYAIASMAILSWSTVLGNKSHNRYFRDSVVLEDSGRGLWIARQSWPFMLATLCHIIYFQSNVIVLKYISGDREAGLYALAFTLLSVSYVLPGVIYQRLLQSDMHRWAYHDPAKLLKAYRLGNWVMLGAGICCSMALIAFAILGLTRVFGDRYQDAVLILVVLSLAVPLRFVSNSAGAVLSTKENVQRKLAIMLAVAAVSLPLNITLVSTFGALGAAYALVLCEGILLIMFLSGAKHALSDIGGA